MRILMITSRYPPNVVGGAEVSAAEAAKGLRARGHDVFVLTARHRLKPSTGESWVRHELPETVDATTTRSGLQRRGVSRAVGFYRELHQRSSARTVIDAVQDTRPDVVYVCNLTGIGMVTALRALRRVDAPLVFQLESYWWHYLNHPRTPFTRVRATWLKRLLIGPLPRLRFSSCIAVSEAVKREYIRAGCPAARIEVIDNAIDARLLRQDQPAPNHAKPARIVIAGRLCAEKGFEVAVAALRSLVSDLDVDAELDVYGVGDRAYETRLRATVTRSALAPRVHFHGRVSRAELLQAYDSASIVWVPSVWAEPFGLVAIEAMARGAVVVASAVGGLASVIDDDVTGVLVEPGDPAALAAATAALLRDDVQRSRISQAALCAAGSRFSLEARAARVERHLERARALAPCEAVWRPERAA